MRKLSPRDRLNTDFDMWLRAESFGFRGIPDFVTLWRPEMTLPSVTFTSLSAGSDKLMVHDALDKRPRVEWERKRERRRETENAATCTGSFVPIKPSTHICTRTYMHVFVRVHVRVTVVGSGRPCPWRGAQEAECLVRVSLERELSIRKIHSSLWRDPDPWRDFPDLSAISRELRVDEEKIRSRNSWRVTPKRIARIMTREGALGFYFPLIRIAFKSPGRQVL